MTSEEPWTVGRVARWVTDDFRAKGLESPRLDAELIVAHALGVERMRILVEPERPLSPSELAVIRGLVKRRRAREPIAYLRGEREFFGRSFVVSPAVLIPRPDTEVLVEVALRRSASPLSLRAADLCTGSGCVAITLAKERPNWHVTGADVSEEALCVARENAARLGAIWNVRWLRSDLFEAFDPSERFELITANPPYIPDAELETLDPGIRDFEPRLALSGGADGHGVTRRLVPEAARRLAPGGVLAVEIMAGSEDCVRGFFAEAGLVAVELTRDYAGLPRVVSGLSIG